MATETFEVNPEAHDAAKLSGEYGKDPGAPEVKPEGEPSKPVISTEDPGEVKVEPEGETPKAEGDETKPAGEKPEGTPPEINDQLETWTAEYLKDGDLSDESRAAVKAALFAPNVPQEIVDQYIDTYIEGNSASMNAVQTEAFDLVGGKQSYGEMCKWAAEGGLTEAERAAFDADATGADAARRDTAIRGLHARYLQASGSQPDHEPDLTHKGGRAPGEPIIGSRQELVRIMRTDEYKRDRAVRERVERQLDQSMKTGKYLNN